MYYSIVIVPQIICYSQLINPKEPLVKCPCKSHGFLYLFIATSSLQQCVCHLLHPDRNNFMPLH